MRIRNHTWSLHSELFTLQYETTQGEKGPVVSPIILTAGFIERKVRNMWGGGGCYWLSF